MDKLWFKARRVISVLLVFAMLASLTPVQVFAEGGDTTPPVETNEPAGEEQAPPEGEPTPAPADPTPAPTAEPTPAPADPTPAPTAEPTPAPADPTPTPADPTPTPAAEPTPTPEVTQNGPARAPANKPALLDEGDPTEGDGDGTEPTEEVPKFTVRFLYGYDQNQNDDDTDDLIVEQTIAQGESAVAPDVPDRPQYIFDGWSVDFTNVQSDLDVSAQWEPITTVTVTIKYQFADESQAADTYQETVVAGTEYKKTIPSPNVPGYKPDKESVEFNLDSITENQEVVVTYSGDDVQYTVYRYLQNVNDDGYTQDGEPEVKTGKAGTLTQAESKEYTGFTEGAIPQLAIAADGSTKVEVYYTRLRYTLTWDTGEGSYVEPVSYKYGATVTKPEPEPTRIGYKFAGWDNMPATMPAQNVTVTAKWTEETTASYTVTYWGEKVEGGYDYLYSVSYEDGRVGTPIDYDDSLDKNKMPESLDVTGF